MMRQHGTPPPVSGGLKIGSRVRARNVPDGNIHRVTAITTVRLDRGAAQTEYTLSNGARYSSLQLWQQYEQVYNGGQ
jgi:hypothetical protein